MRQKNKRSEGTSIRQCGDLGGSGVRVTHEE